MEMAEMRGFADSGNGEIGGDFAKTRPVTWQQAEDALTAAIEYLFAMPDREGALLAPGYGRRLSGWPAIVRSVREGDYGDGQGVGEDAATPSPRLSRAMASLVEAMLTGERPLANAIPEGHRRLVGRVIAMKRWPGAEGFGWDRVWRAQGGVLFSLRDQQVRKVTSDAMRKAYERAIGRLAVKIEASSAQVRAVVRA